MVARFTKYLRSGSRTDQLPTITGYTTLGTAQYTRRDLILGLIYATSPDIVPEYTYGYRHRRLLMYSNAEDLAFTHLHSALRLHPGDWLAGVAMARVALGVRHTRRLDESVRALAQLMTADPENITVRVALADVLMAQDSAPVALRILKDVHDRCAAAAHAYSQALILTGDTMGGARLYLETLRSSPDQLDRFAEDVIATLPFDDRMALDTVPPAGLASWLLNYWERSSARSARSPEERIAAHLRRIHHAQLHYRKQHDPVLPKGELSSRLLVEVAPPWDARGEVYIRHGEPDTVISSLQGVHFLYIPRNESWLYARDEPQWMFHFTWVEGRDWKLETPYIGCGGPTPDPRKLATRGRPSPEAAKAAVFGMQYYLDRAPFNDYFGDFAKHCMLVSAYSRDHTVHNAIRRMQESYDTLMVTTLRTESARYQFRRPIRLRVNAYGFRAGSAPEYVAVVWVAKAGCDRRAVRANARRARGTPPARAPRPRCC